jgi:hypothetical protein
MRYEGARDEEERQSNHESSTSAPPTARLQHARYEAAFIG